jgi:hypothetical protein
MLLAHLNFIDVDGVSQPFIRKEAQTPCNARVVHYKKTLGKAEGLIQR